MMSLLPTTEAEDIARRAALTDRANSWSGLVVNGSVINEEAERIRAALQTQGIEAHEIRLAASVHQADRPLLRPARGTLLVYVDDDAGEAAWRSLEHQRSMSVREGATLLLMTEGAWESLQGRFVHLMSWLGGSVWRLSFRGLIEELVKEGRIGKARQLLAAHPEEDVGPVARALEPPRSVGMSPASGRGDFPDNAEWLRQNHRFFAGRWVALNEGELVDSDQSFAELQRRQRSRTNAEDLLYVKVQE